MDDRLRLRLGAETCSAAGLGDLLDEIDLATKAPANEALVVLMERVAAGSLPAEAAPDVLRRAPVAALAAQAISQVRREDGFRHVEPEHRDAVALATGPLLDHLAVEVLRRSCEHPAAGEQVGHGPLDEAAELLAEAVHLLATRGNDAERVPEPAVTDAVQRLGLDPATPAHAVLALLRLRLAPSVEAAEWLLADTVFCPAGVRRAVSAEAFAWLRELRRTTPDARRISEMLVKFDAAAEVAIHGWDALVDQMPGVLLDGMANDPRWWAGLDEGQVAALLDHIATLTQDTDRAWIELEHPGPTDLGSHILTAVLFSADPVDDLSSLPGIQRLAEWSGSERLQRRLRAASNDRGRSADRLRDAIASAGDAARARELLAEILEAPVGPTRTDLLVELLLAFPSLVVAAADFGFSHGVLRSVRAHAVDLAVRGGHDVAWLMQLLRRCGACCLEVRTDEALWSGDKRLLLLEVLDRGAHGECCAAGPNSRLRAMQGLQRLGVDVWPLVEVAEIRAVLAADPGTQRPRVPGLDRALAELAERRHQGEVLALLSSRDGTVGELLEAAAALAELRRAS